MSFETGLLVVYMVLILLPWAGGLLLTVAQYWVMTRQITDLQKENGELKKQVAGLYKENMKLDLNLQQTLIENAVLATRQGDEGETSSG